MRVAVVIPCYRVSKHINGVLETLPKFIEKIYLIDDFCPENSTSKINKNNDLKKIKIINHEKNQGVGGAVKSGYREALKDNFQIIVKIDGDGQMNGGDIERLIRPIIDKKADYVKGNRFMRYQNIKSMPFIRLIGNAALSFITKFSSGYWNIADPTNGLTAIHRSALMELPLDKISDRYFFESDMLFRLGMVSAVVNDIPIKSEYKDEVSGLSVKKIVFEFLYKNIKNYFKRIIYFYYIREVNIASFELPVGLLLLMYGLYYGIANWIASSSVSATTPTGVIMISVTSIMVGIQLLLSFMNFDISSTPKFPISD